MTLLIVEHDKATAWTLSEGLARDGHTITTVTRGADALREMEQSAYDACLMADDLLDMPGAPLALALHHADPSLKVIAMTSVGAPLRMEARDRLGVCEVLAKPFSLAAVRASVVRVCDSPESTVLRRAA